MPQRQVPSFITPFAVAVQAKFVENRLAAKFGMGRRTLIRRFKAAAGETPLRCLQRFRVEVAKVLLEQRQHTFD